jgi:alpha-beta hydrolase superfamily lysophospholipase
LVGEAYFADPLVHTSTTPRMGAQAFAAIDRVRASIERLHLPTLVLHGGLDTIVPPGSTAFVGELEGVERRLYPGLRHEILNEPEGPQVVSDIVDWIARHL